MLHNRDLSWIGFNHRVLLEAKDKSLPLYNRIKFLAIFSSNLDEFFRVRYPVLVALSTLNKKLLRKETLLTEEDVSTKVHQVISAQLQEFGNILFKDILPELEQSNVVLYYNKPFEEEHKSEINEIFISKILSFIQPVMLSTERAGALMLENNELYLIATLQSQQTKAISHVLVNIPSKQLQRFYVLTKLHGKNYIAFIDDIVRQNLPMLFPGKTILGSYSIKINRNAELNLTDNFTINLLDKIEKQLQVRDMGNTSRFLYEQGMPDSMKLYISDFFKIDVGDMFEGGRYHNLSDFFKLPNFHPELEHKVPPPILYPAEIVNGDLFNIVSKKDLLLHLPYQSYAPVLTFFNQAAIDERVTEIYITLYRVATESHIVNALISAAKNGKKVTAFVELKARFDEANNIKWSRVMKKAGIRLIYSDVHLKVHSKTGLIKMRKGSEVASYGVISTGNFNESTANLYTDHVLFTASKQTCGELNQLFRFMQMRRPNFELAKTKLKFKNLYVSQFNLIPDFERYIEDEIQKAKVGKEAMIRIKVNNLEEPRFINKLYAASKAGVKVQLLVRSICSLLPGVVGLSENIEVHRIVDALLEHSRLFIFGAGENVRVVMGSTDLMTRNLYRRIEVCLRVKDKDCKQQLLDYFNLQWADNTKAYSINADGSQTKIENGLPKQNAQNNIYAYLKNRNDHRK